MADIDNNVTVDITGNTADIATDYTTSGVTNAHVQIMKVAFGSPTTATRVTTSNPLPVDIRAVTATLGITGSVAGLGNFKIVNGLAGATALALVVAGTTESGYAPVQINGLVQGITNGVLVGVTGSVYTKDGSRIQGLTSGYPIAVTGGRYLSSSTDSVTISGTVGISGGRYMMQSTDAIRIFGGNGGETMIPVTLKDGSGNSISSSGGALNVNVIGSGFTATVSVATLIGICQANQAIPLFVAGATAGPAVRVEGTLGANSAVEVGWSTAQNVAVTSAVENNDALITAVEYLQNNHINSILTNTNNLDAIYNQITGSGVNTQIVGVTRPSSVYTGSLSITTTTTSIAAQQLKTGITIKASAGDVRVKGTGSTNPYLLSSGEILFIETNNLNNLSFSTSTGTATLYYIAT